MTTELQKVAGTSQVPERETTDSALDRLRALGLKLPVLAGNPYYVDHRAVGESIHISGQLPYKDGELLGQGILGRDVDVETARELARHAVLNCLAAAVQAVGDLERVRIVQMLVFVASTPDFGLQSRVAEAASELLIEVLGENGGMPAPRLVLPGCRASLLSRSK